MSDNKYDLEERTLQFAINCRLFLKTLIKTISNIEDGKQLVKSSGSVGANEALSKKDLCYRIKISRKEAKESAYWLKIIKAVNLDFDKPTSILIQEATELKMILLAILEKSKKSFE